MMLSVFWCLVIRCCGPVSMCGHVESPHAHFKLLLLDITLSAMIARPIGFWVLSGCCIALHCITIGSPITCSTILHISQA